MQHLNVLRKMHSQNNKNQIRLEAMIRIPKQSKAKLNSIFQLRRIIANAIFFKILSSISKN